MQTSSLFHPLTSTGAPFSGKLRHRGHMLCNDHNRLATILLAYKKDGSDSEGKMVDENMIVLRERIRKMKEEMEHNSGGDRLPANWMQWEKTYFYSGDYHSHIYEMIALLQRFLMDCRPSVVLGLVVLFAVGGSTAAVLVLQCLINFIQGS
ncbi:hypothetical protein HanPI659440_Chr12g0454541 [Helianthus annuus]|nr:hypothetical protein HanPI659440_Chr12g0454541 [Helianthus annuus]